MDNAGHAGTASRHHGVLPVGLLNADHALCGFTIDEVLQLGHERPVEGSKEAVAPDHLDPAGLGELGATEQQGIGVGLAARTADENDPIALALERSGELGRHAMGTGAVGMGQRHEDGHGRTSGSTLPGCERRANGAAGHLTTRSVGRAGGEALASCWPPPPPEPEPGGIPGRPTSIFSRRSSCTRRPRARGSARRRAPRSCRGTPAWAGISTGGPSCRSVTVHTGTGRPVCIRWTAVPFWSSIAPRTATGSRRDPPLSALLRALSFQEARNVPRSSSPPGPSRRAPGPLLARGGPRALVSGGVAARRPHDIRSGTRTEPSSRPPEGSWHRPASPAGPGTTSKKPSA